MENLFPIRSSSVILCYKLIVLAEWRAAIDSRRGESWGHVVYLVRTRKEVACYGEYGLTVTVQHENFILPGKYGKCSFLSSLDICSLFASNLGSVFQCFFVYHFETLMEGLCNFIVTMQNYLRSSVLTKADPEYFPLIL